MKRSMLIEQCPCGSGLKGKRTTLVNATGYRYVCDKCRPMFTTKPKEAYLVSSSSEKDARNAQARRRLEELRDTRTTADLW
jgi:ribosome-binding protein aMBF1 (putative translation factor)